MCINTDFKEKKFFFKRWVSDDFQTYPLADVTAQ